jgi:hypothetical protein
LLTPLDYSTEDPEDEVMLCCFRFRDARPRVSKSRGPLVCVAFHSNVAKIRARFLCKTCFQDTTKQFARGEFVFMTEDAAWETRCLS